MSLKENEIKAQLASLERQKEEINYRISILKKNIWEEETNLIGINLTMDKLKEELKKINLNKA